MCANEVVRLRLGDVSGRLLKGLVLSPGSWVAWRAPTPALPIDELITSMSRRNTTPRLLSPPELRERKIDCPYFGARWAIALAVEAAATEAAVDPVEMAERWRGYEEAACQAAAANAAIAGSLLNSRPSPRLPFIDAPELTCAYAKTREIQHARYYEIIAEQAQRWRQIYRQTRGDPFDLWRVVFAAQLAFTWLALTNVMPARNEGFTDFIETAYASIDDKMPEVSWERAIRHVASLDIEWERGRVMSLGAIQKIFSECLWRNPQHWTGQ